MPRGAGRNYVTVTVDGKAQVVFSCELSKHGDLLLFLPQGNTFEDDTTASSLQGRTIEQQRYSIHPSPEIPDQNMIKHTISAGGERKTSVHFTKAIKSTFCFAPLFACLARPNLEELNQRGGTIVRSLGRYEPKRFSLYYITFVGPAARRFEFPDVHCFNVASFDIGTFRLVTLYGFMSFPAFRAKFTHFVTLDPEQTEDPVLRSASQQFSEGVTEAQAIILGAELNIRLSNKNVAEIQATYDLPEDVKRSLSIIDIYKDGYRGSKSWNEILARQMLARSVET